MYLGCTCQDQKLAGVADFFNSLIPGAQEAAKNIAAMPGSQAEALAKMITRIDVETAYGPPIVLNDPFAPGPPNPYLKALKPRVTIQVAGQQIQMKPYGDPGVTKWPLVATGAALVGAVGLAYVGYKAVRLVGKVIG